MDRPLKSFSNVSASEYKLQTSSLRSMPGGMGKSITLEGPRIQLPIARVPWDCSYVDTRHGRPQAKLTLSLDNESNNHGMLQDFMEELDKQVLNELVKAKSEIFKANTDENKIRANFYSSVKPSSDPSKYGPTITFKMDFVETNGGGFDITTPAVIENALTQELEDVDTAQALAQGSKITAMVYPSMVWGMSGNASSGIQWKVAGVKVKELGVQNQPMVFLPDPEE